MSDGDLLEQLPPGPWTWRQVTPETFTIGGQLQVNEPAGVALVSADGSWVLWSEGGWGTPETAGGDGPWAAVTGRPLPPVVRALAMVPELLDEHEDLTVALDECIEVLRQHGALTMPLPETARDIVAVLGGLVDRMRETNTARLGARQASFTDMLEAYVSEFGVSSLEELRAQLREIRPAAEPGPALDALWEVLRSTVNRELSGELDAPFGQLLAQEVMYGLELRGWRLERIDGADS